MFVCKFCDGLRVEVSCFLIFCMRPFSLYPSLFRRSKLTGDVCAQTMSAFALKLKYSETCIKPIPSRNALMPA